MRFTPFRSFMTFLIILVFLSGSGLSQAKPLVLSSLKPLTLIAQEVVGNKAEVDSLLPASASHHDYPLKVSDHARLQKADVFVWIGPELESFLQKPVSNLPASKIVTIYDLKGINWPAETASISDGEHHHHDHDPHIWLNPRNAVVIAEALTIKLSALDVANAQEYKANLKAFSAKMKELDEKLQGALKPFSNVGFAVYHQGFAHFVQHYGLRQLDYLMLTPEQKPGAKHMYQLRKNLAGNGECLFLEPYSNTQTAQNLAQELHLRVGRLDALGVQDVKTYSQLLEQMAADFSTCLANGRN